MDKNENIIQRHMEYFFQENFDKIDNIMNRNVEVVPPNVDPEILRNKYKECLIIKDGIDMEVEVIMVPVMIGYKKRRNK